MFIWQEESLIKVVISAIAMVVVFVGSLVMLLKISLKRKVVILYIISSFIAALTFIFNSLPGFIAISCFTVSMFSTCLIGNIGEVRKLIGNHPHKKTVRISKFNQKSEGLQTINDAVLELSANKVGALITFERNIALDEFSKNGVAINAPINKELLLSIFYPGTKLHDGAVIIRDNLIAYASVFYTPTTKSISGKYGSRHRAALGISEMTDSVTVVVSEETGKISIVFNGDLESVSPSNFLRVLESSLSREK
mgnify:CR=1 FL=1